MENLDEPLESCTVDQWIFLSKYRSFSDSCGDLFKFHLYLVSRFLRCSRHHPVRDAELLASFAQIQELLAAPVWCPPRQLAERPKYRNSRENKLFFSPDFHDYPTSWKYSFCSKMISNFIFTKFVEMTQMKSCTCPL